VKAKDEVLRRHCEEVGRDESEIERTASMGVCIIRDDPAEAQRVLAETFRHNGNAKPWEDQLVGTPEQVADKLRPYLGIGFRHFSVGCPPPFDAESMERLIRDVKPMLEAG
jgi:alkanesulfonate monooxygenase SsuD/methylene tetrahydromethanopterin reductase-like flavin-dependent oxidoreductase (luciferase family)